jgi:DNA-binding beta-propeller fold protein YncE
MRRVRRIIVVAVAAIAAALGGTNASSEASNAPYGVFVVDTSGTVVHVDPSAGTVGPAIPVGQGAADIAITADRSRAYVAKFFSNSVVPIDLTLGTATVMSAIPVPCPGSIVLVPGRAKAYVFQGCGRGTIVPLDLSTSAAGTPILVGQQPFQMAVTPDGSTLWVTVSGGGPMVPNTLTPVDVASETVGTPIQLGVGKNLAGVAITPDGGTAFVASQSDDVVIPVDLASRTVGVPMAVPHRPDLLAVTRDGATLYATHFAETPTGLGEPTPGGVTPIDLATRTALSQIDAGQQTRGIAVSDDGTTVFVTRTGTAQPDAGPALVPIDVATNTAGAAIPITGQLYAAAIGPPISSVVADTTAPTVQLQTTPGGPTGGSPWFNAQDLAGGMLTVTAIGSDAGSGVSSVSCDWDGLSQTVVGDRLVVQGLGDGVHQFSCRATDNVGNVTDPPVTATYRVDTRAPTLAPTVTGSGLGGAVLLSDPAAVASPNANDVGGSGVASSSCGAIDVSAVGVRPLTCSATDVAGNARTEEVSYVVQYLLVGLTPADGTTVRAGQPLKVAVLLADANGAPAALCAGCSVQFQAFATVGGALGQDAGPFPMRLNNGSSEFRGSWKPAASPTGNTWIVVTVSTSQGTAFSWASALITLT